MLVQHYAILTIALCFEAIRRPWIARSGSRSAAPLRSRERRRLAFQVILLRGFYERLHCASIVAGGEHACAHCSVLLDTQKQKMTLLRLSGPRSKKQWPGNWAATMQDG